MREGAWPGRRLCSQSDSGWWARDASSRKMPELFLGETLQGGAETRTGPQAGGQYMQCPGPGQHEVPGGSFSSQ